MQRKKKIIHILLALYYIAYVVIFPVVVHADDQVVSPTPEQGSQSQENQNSGSDPVISPEPAPSTEPAQDVTPEVSPEPSISPEISPIEEAPSESQPTTLPTPTIITNPGDQIPSPTPTPAPSKKMSQTISDSVDKSGITDNKFIKGVGTSVDSISNSLSKTIKKFTNEKAKIHKLRDYVFSTNHPIEFTVEKSQDHVLKIKAKSPHGRIYDLQYDDDYNKNGSLITILPPRSMEPGKYELTITDESGEVTKEEFLWGVLALNTNKSVYTPDQDATIAMAVLDETGEIVCDADVNLEILLPDSTTKELSTKNKDIAINDVCGKKEFTLDPDYEAHYTVNQIGTYKLKLTAKTKNGEYSIDDSFQVKETVDFDVERVSATRLYPVLTYPMYINITANQDFEGVVTDIVPEDFDVLPSGEGQEYRDVLKSSDRGHGTSEGQVLAAETNNLRKPYDGDHIITLGFGKQYGIEELIDKIFKKNNIEGHDGVDIDMPTGTPIFATDGGKVIKAGKGVYGNTIVIEHAWGQSYYGHLKDIEVVEGDTVDRGQEIGLSGSTGISTGPHLHFSIKPHDAQEDNGYHGMIDPQSLIAFEDVSEDNFKSAVLGATTSNLFPTKTITWEVHLKKGERVKLGYTYHTPITSPEFYRLGKLSIIEQDIKEEAQTNAGEKIEVITDTDANESSQASLDNFTKLKQSDSFKKELKNAQAEALKNATPEATIEARSEAKNTGTVAGAETEKKTPGEQTQPENQGKIVFEEQRFWQLAIDSVVVTGGITEAETQFGGLQRKVAYVNSNWYAFHNDAGKITYKKSADGVSWNSPVDVDSDSDNYNPTIAVSGNIIHVFWVDDGGEVLEGRRIDTASADAQGTLCATASQGTISSSFMASVAEISTTEVLLAYSDTSSDSEVDVFDITGLSGACTVTDVQPGNLPFGTQGSGITAGDRPVVVGLSSTVAMMIFTDGSNLRSAKFNVTNAEWIENSQVIANVSDSVYSVANSSTDVWVMTVSGTTATNFYHYPKASAGLVETSSAVDSDVGAAADEQDNDVDITCPSVTNCKIVYIDNQDTTTPDLDFVDCDNADCSSFGAGTPRVLNADIGSASEHDSNPAIFCLSSGANCKIVYGTNLDTTTPDVVLIDCNDDDCDTVTSGTINADVGETTTPKVWAELYCLGDTDCQVVYLDNDLTSGSLVLADCSNAQCSTTNSNGAIQTNINNAQTTAYNLQMDIWCVASGDCRIVYQDGLNSDMSYLDCTKAACTGLTPQDIDTNIGGGTATSVPMSIDCSAGSADCKMIYADANDTALFFVDCDAAACTTPTITTIDDVAGNINFSQVSLDCSRGATDCKGTWTGITTGGSERLYFFDCDSAACDSGSAVQLASGAETRGAVACTDTADCKLAYFRNDTPTLRFADCTNENCAPEWESLTAPWSSQTNVTSVSLTYDSTNTQLIANIIKDSSEQAYYKSTPASSISWSSETSWAFTAGDLGHISASKTAAGTGQVGVVLRQGSNFEFSKLPAFRISGVCKQFDRTTNCTDGETIALAINGASQAETGTTSSGTWYIDRTSVPSAADRIWVYPNGVANANEGVAFTKYDGSGWITGMAIYEDHLSLGSADNQTITNTNLSGWDNSTSTDEDITYDVSLDGGANFDINLDSLNQSSQETLYVVSGNTFDPEQTTFQSTVTTVNVVIESGATILADEDDDYQVSGSWTNNGTYNSTCSTAYPRNFFVATSTGKTISGNLNGSSDFCKVTFNGSGGGWTIQDPMLISNANATDTLEVTAGTVTLGNGGGDNLDVRGRFTISSGATFQSMTGLAQGDSTACNSDDICIEINANSSPPSCSNCTIENSGTFDIDKNVTVRFNSNASVESGLNNSSTGYLEIQGTQDDTGTDTGTSNTYREGQICANESYVNDQHNNKYVRMIDGLARGRIYAINDTIQSDTNCTTTTDDSILINDTSSVTDSSPTVSCSGNKCVLTLSSETIITAAKDHIGRYVHDKQGTEGYYLIIDSTETGSDTLTVIGDPSTLSLANNDDIQVVDGIRSGDNYEILDYAEVTANATNNGFIHNASGSEMIMRYAKAAELGAETSNKYGINGASINAANSSEGFLIEKSYISNSHRSIRCDSCTNLDQINTSGAINNYIYNFSQEGVDFGGTTNTEITGNRIDTGNVGNGDGIIHYAAYNGLVYNNIVTNTIYGIVANLGSGHDIVGNKVYDATTYELYNTDSEENSWIDNDAFGATAQGIYVPTTENIYLGSNQVDIGTVALDITNASATNFVAAEEAYGYYSGLSTADVRYGSTGAHKGRFYNSYFGSSTEVSGVTTTNAFLASFKHDQTNGTSKIWNDYVVPDNNSETPQTEGTEKFNYADNLWEDSITPHYFTGTGSDPTTISLAYSGGTLGGSSTVVAYRVTCKNSNCVTSGTNAWDVYRNGVDIGDASTTSTFTDGTTNVQFNITDAGTDYARGDTFTFMAFNDSNNANAQKSITMMQNGDGYSIGSGETVQLIGTSSSNTLISAGGGSYGFQLIGGTFNANYYTFTGLGQSGLLFSSGTVSNLSGGTFDNSGGDGASNPYIGVEGAIINSTGAQTWTDMVFDDASADVNVLNNVALLSLPSGCSNAWTFNSSGNKGGASNGETNDSDAGDGGGCNSGNGYLLWNDNGPTNDQLMRHGDWFNSLSVRQSFTF